MSAIFGILLGFFIGILSATQYSMTRLENYIYVQNSSKYYVREYHKPFLERHKALREIGYSQSNGTKTRREPYGILIIMFDYGAQNNQHIPYERVVYRLLRSIRQHNTGVRVALATNNMHINSSAFDIVYTPFEWQNTTQEIVSKITGLQNSPFEKTIFLDAETVVLGSVMPLFEFLEWYDMALTPQNNWQGAWYLEQILCGGSVVSLEIQYNTGVFAYRDTKTSQDFFNKWKMIHETSPCRLKVLSNGKKRGAFDQCGLSQAIRKTSGLKVATLDADVWNDRLIKSHSEPTRVAHPHCTTTHGTGCNDNWIHPDHGRRPKAPIYTTYSKHHCNK